jgi:hypothetical protein
MFESLFAQRSAIARCRSAPLLKERIRYLAHCEQIGIKPATLRKMAFHQLIFVRALDLQDDDVDLILCKIEAWYRRWSLPEERTSRPRARRADFSHADRWLHYLGWRSGPEAACHAHTREVAAFAAHVTGECGWSDATIESCCRTVNRFFFWLDETDVDLASVEITMIDQVIANYHARSYCLLAAVKTRA